MKKYMSHVLVGICSFLAGAGVSAYIVKNKTMNEIKNDYLEELDSIRSEYEVRYRELIDKNNKEKEDLLNASNEEKRTIVDDILDAHFNTKKEEEVEDIKEPAEPFSIFDETEFDYRAAELEGDEKMEDIVVDDDLNSEDDYIELTPVNKLNPNSKVPYLLHSMNDFGEIEGYNLCSLTYYKKSDVLYDENDNEVVANPYFRLGYDIMDYLKNVTRQQLEDEVIYVRDDTLECDYEVLVNFDDSYPESF